MCSRHPLSTTVHNGAHRDHDAGDDDRTDAVMARSAEAWQGYTAPVVIIARAARVQRGTAADPAAQQGDPPDIWTDHLSMQRLVLGYLPDAATQSEHDKINKRVRRFRYSNGLLYRIFTDDSMREGP